MGQTPIYALPWPEPTDPADGPAGYQALALATEAALGAPVTSLPSSPIDGQVVRYRAGTEGPVWSFVYLAGSASPYRWHAIGAPVPLRAEVLTASGVGGTGPAYGDPTSGTAGPSLTLPLAGVYLFDYSAEAYNAAGDAKALLSIGGATINEAWRLRINGTAHIEATQARTDVPGTVVTAATVAKLVYQTIGAVVAQWQGRHLAARPVRVA